MVFGPYENSKLFPYTFNTFYGAKIRIMSMRTHFTLALPCTCLLGTLILGHRESLCYEYRLHCLAAFSIAS